MAEQVCPVWIGYFLLSPLRKLFQNPNKILSPYVKDGMKGLVELSLEIPFEMPHFVRD